MSFNLKNVVLGNKKRLIVSAICAVIFMLTINNIAANTSRIAGENSVSSLEHMQIGGIEQWLMIRGENIANPVILILHGGPGSAEMPLIKKYCSALEKDFIVVAWDQRGAGKSYNKEIPLETMNEAQYISDTNEVVQYLKERFKKEKIILIGHSWGSNLGMNIINKHPEDYYAYIGTGQIVNGIKNEETACRVLQSMAKKEGNKEAVKELKEIAAFKDGVYKNGINGLENQRKWLMYYGGFCYGKKSINHLYKDLLLAEEYSIIDKINYIKGCQFSADAMWQTQWLYKIKLDEQITEVKVPVYICQGVYDLNTVYSLAKDYYEKLKAPKKEFITFHKSSHCVPFEEPEKFNNTVKDIAKELGLI